MNPTISLETIPNFRDLGGHATTDGRRVKQGRVFRSGMLAGATKADLQTLSDIGVRTVVDLRTPIEIEVFGSDRIPAGATGIELNLPMVGPEPAVEEAIREGRFPYLPDLIVSNRAHARNDAPRIGELIGLLADERNQAVIFHCLGGKDRTGVTAAILLSLLGVPWETVRQDYLASNESHADTTDGKPSAMNRAIEKRLGYLPDFGDEESRRAFFVVKPSYIDVVLDEMTKGGRTVHEYATHEMGLSDAAIQQLRESLLE